MGVEEEFSSQQQQLSDILQASKLDANVVHNVTSKLDTVLNDKNRMIKNLEYRVDQETKRYNDCVSVYEAKLRKLGVPSEELGFEPVPSDYLGKMPAEMV